MKKNYLIAFIFYLASHLLQAQITTQKTFYVDDLLTKGIEQLSKPHLGGAQGMVNSSFSKSKMKEYVTKNLILERSSEFSKISSFNTDGNVADKDYFEQAITDIHLASNKKLYTDYHGISKIIKNDLNQKNIVNVAILNTSFNKINYDTEDPLNPEKGYYLINKALVPIVGKQQFIKLHATVISPLKKTVTGDVITFKFRDELLFSNGKKIKNLRADLGDGFYRTIIANSILVAKKISIAIFKSQKTKQTYELTYANGQSQITHSYLYTRSISAPPSIKANKNYLRKDFVHISKYPFKGYTENKAYRGQINSRVFFAESNFEKKIKRPIFILEGFDPSDKRKIENTDYTNPNDTLRTPPLFDKMIYGRGKNLILTLNKKGYDVIICNFPTHQKKNKIIDGGADYVERNSLAFVSFIQEINQKLKSNNSKEELVILGPSMGAIVSRYALAYMEKKLAETNDQQWNHNTKLWVSMDGPHLGANIPIGIQSALYLVGYIGKSAGAKRSYDVTLKSVTAQQFLINQHKEGTDSYNSVDNTYMNGRVTEQGFTSNSGSPFYQKFYKTLYNNGLPNSKGFPLHTRKVAIINGSIKGNQIGTNNQQTVLMKGYVKLCAVLGNICSKMHVTTIGTWNMPNKGETQVVAKFKKAFKVMTTKATNYSTRGNFDLLSGGYTDTFNQITQQTVETTNDAWKTKDRLTLGISKLLRGEINNFKVKKNVQNHGFIPVASALAIHQPKRDWGGDFTQDILNDLGELTPFDNYFIPDENEDHVELTTANVDWLLKEIDGKNPKRLLKEVNPKEDLETIQTPKKIPVTNGNKNDTFVFTTSTPDVNMYPNPSNGVIYIEPHQKIQQLKIYSTKGELVYEAHQLKHPKINLTHLKNDVYFAVIIYQNGKQIKQKLIIMN